jgi:hypothetical protein
MPCLGSVFVAEVLLQSGAVLLQARALGVHTRLQLGRGVHVMQQPLLQRLL